MATHSPVIEQAFPQPARAANVDIGRQDFLSTLWRLTRVELYKLRHRRYSRVILALLLALTILFTVLLGVTSFNEANAPAAKMMPLQCSAQVTNGCTTQHYSQAQLEHLKTLDLQHNATSLGFPGSLAFVMEVFSYSLVGLLGLLLLAPIVGTEYSLGTIRLLFTRGPTRLQCMLGKALAGLLYTAGVLLLLALTYVIVGMLVYPMVGEPYAYAFSHFHDAVFGNALWLSAITIVYWYAFGVLAIFFGTLGRSTAAALGGVFAWFIFESVAPYLLGFFMNLFTSGPINDLLKAIPDYLLLTNIDALVTNRLAVLGISGVSTISDGHAVIVVCVYFVLLIGASCLITMRRDVTN